MKIGIVGYGVVGKAQSEFWGKDNCIIHDPSQGFKNRALINKECDIAFVCVPTPMKEDGSCDLSIVEESVKWLETPIIVIRSTVVPGTCARLTVENRMDGDKEKNIVFEPEYLGETIHHPYLDLRKRPFVILGGMPGPTRALIMYMQKFMHPDTKFFQTDWNTAELVKYMENSWLATKVTFCNEFYEIASIIGVDYNELRELWLADERINRSHTFVYPDKRGFSGKCLPKDLNAIVTKLGELGYEAKFIKDVLENNERIKKIDHDRGEKQAV
jgi:UDPglucose 6-dehydrogenase